MLAYFARKADAGFGDFAIEVKPSAVPRTPRGFAPHKFIINQHEFVVPGEYATTRLELTAQISKYLAASPVEHVFHPHSSHYLDRVRFQGAESLIEPLQRAIGRTWRRIVFLKQPNRQLILRGFITI